VLSNLKGGVGKTVTTIQLAHAAAALRMRVLVVDADPQGNITRALSEGQYSNAEPPAISLADVLDRRAQASVREAILSTRREGISLLPSGFDELQAVQDSLIGKPGAEHSIARVLREVDEEFDFVFIDSRPATDLITRNAFMAADGLVVVVQPELWAIGGLQMTLSAVEDLKEYLDKDLPVAGWIINKVDNRRSDHSDSIKVIEKMAADEDIRILGEAIPSTADLARLSDIGWGCDEHPKPTPRIRNLAAIFAAMFEQLSTPASEDLEPQLSVPVSEGVSA
jgi:chromosome partitioning protein